MTQGQTRASFIEEARRRQIVETAIRTIAARGYSQSSLAEIAREAGISKGVISYHFEGKLELVEAILSRLLEEPAEFIKQRVDASAGAADKLRAYIRANFEFMKTHRENYVALVDLWESRASHEGGNRFSAEAYAPSRAYLSRILESGREAGEFRRRPSATLASVIQAAIDGVMLQWVFDERTVDLDACRDEILELISRHVAAPTSPSTTGATP
jgi:AcrR family transcriptional regulator